MLRPPRGTLSLARAALRAGACTWALRAGLARGGEASGGRARSVSVCWRLRSMMLCIRIHKKGGCAFHVQGWCRRVLGTGGPGHVGWGGSSPLLALATAWGLSCALLSPEVNAIPVIGWGRFRGPLPRQPGLGQGTAGPSSRAGPGDRLPQQQGPVQGTAGWDHRAGRSKRLRVLAIGGWSKGPLALVDGSASKSARLKSSFFVMNPSLAQT